MTKLPLKVRIHMSKIAKDGKKKRLRKIKRSKFSEWGLKGAQKRWGKTPKTEVEVKHNLSTDEGLTSG